MKTMHHEDTESQALWSRAQLVPVLRDCLYHVANGGNRNLREAARLKRMGVRPGVHDYHLPVPRGIYHSLYVELKPDVKGYYPNVSTEQIKWRRLMRNMGNAAYIIKGWEKAFDVMQRYLNLKDGEMLEHAQSGEYDTIC